MLILFFLICMLCVLVVLVYVTLIASESEKQAAYRKAYFWHHRMHK